MIKIVKDNLDEVYKEACSKLECSIEHIHIDIVQYPRNIFGIIKKQAIVIAYKKDIDNNTLKSEEFKTSIKQTKNKENENENIIDIKEPNTSTQEHYKKHTKQVLDNFYQKKEQQDITKDALSQEKIISEIKYNLQDIFCIDSLDYKLDKVEFENEKTIYIQFSGQDASLIIGKNGFRYKALSYLIFSWIFAKYNLFVKIEVGEFLFNQNEMIKKHLQEFVIQIDKFGYGNTDCLDGVLLHLGVEHLRKTFPNKMVTIKKNKDSTRYIKVSDFR